MSSPEKGSLRRPCRRLRPWTSVRRAGPDATGLTGIDMTTVMARVRVAHIGEGLAIRRVVGVHAIADAVVREATERSTRQHAGDRARGDVGDIVGHATAVRKAGGIVVVRIAIEERQERETTAMI